MLKQILKTTHLVMLCASTMVWSCGGEGGLELETFFQAEESFHVVIGSQSIIWDVNSKKVVFSVKNPLPKKVQCNFSASVKVSGVNYPDKYKGTLFVDRSDDFIFPSQKVRLEMPLDGEYLDMKSSCPDKTEDFVLAADQADIKTDCKPVEEPENPDPATLPFCQANDGKGYGAPFDCGEGRRCAKADPGYTQWCVIKNTTPPPPPVVHCWYDTYYETDTYVSPGKYRIEVLINGRRDDTGTMIFVSATEARYYSDKEGGREVGVARLSSPGAMGFNFTLYSMPFISSFWSCDGAFVTGR